MGIPECPSPKFQPEILEECGLIVLEPVRLVDDECGPLDGGQNRLVHVDALVRRQQHVEFHVLLRLEARCAGTALQCTEIRGEE